jgi:hypothetical protein
MKSEKEKLQAKSVEQLRASYKRMGGKMVNGDGKAKTKVDLINGIVMKNRLAGKSMGAKHTGMVKKPAVKKTMAKKPATMLAEKPYKDLPELRVFLLTS